MKFYLNHRTIHSSELVENNPDDLSADPVDRMVLSYAKSWLTGVESFQFQTSGSTGRPKSILLTRHQLEYSARNTLHFLFGDDLPQRMLLCINPKYIGGKQVITRALISNADLWVMPPSSLPIPPESHEFDLVSMVPMQIQSIQEKQPSLLDRFKYIIIGGAPLSPSVEKSLSRHPGIYHTYGMTETASHVALRKVGEEYFKAIGDIEFQVDDLGALKLRGTVTLGEWLSTHDQVVLHDEGFQWLGRSDWVINSGGVKLHPESIEGKIGKMTSKGRFVLTQVPDARLGQRLVLASEIPLLEKIKTYGILDPYEIPKDEVVISDWPMTGEKTDRLAIQRLAEKELLKNG
jgi:O-succinylbenzoic acid--CoA ligase